MARFRVFLRGPGVIVGCITSPRYENVGCLIFGNARRRETQPFKPRICLRVNR